MYPRVKYEIYSATADDIKDDLEKGILDMGLLTEPVDIGKYAFIRMPGKGTVGRTCAQRQHACAKRVRYTGGFSGCAAAYRQTRRSAQ